MRKFGVFRHFWSDWLVASAPPERGCVRAVDSELSLAVSLLLSLEAEDRGPDGPQGVPAAPAWHGCSPQPLHSSALNGKSGSGWGWCCECLVALK